MTHLKWRQIYKTALPAHSAVIEKWKSSHRLRRKVQIKTLDRISIPLTYGVVRPVIVLPTMICDCKKEELEYVLTHEYMHIRKNHVLVKLVLLISLCIHWFNPFVWIMYIVVNRDIEIWCDEHVLKESGTTKKSDYASSLIGMQEMTGKISPLCNGFNKNAIEERIHIIMKSKKATSTGLFLSMFLSLYYNKGIWDIGADKFK